MGRLFFQNAKRGCDHSIGFLFFVMVVMSRVVPAWVRHKIERGRCVKQDPYGNFLEECMRAKQKTYYLVLKGHNSRRNVGCLKKYKWSNGENVLVLKRNDDYHYHRKVDGYGVSDMFLRYVYEVCGNINIIINESTKKVQYHTDIETFLDK